MHLYACRCHQLTKRNGEENVKYLFYMSFKHFIESGEAYVYAGAHLRLTNKIKYILCAHGQQRNDKKAFSGCQLDQSFAHFIPHFSAIDEHPSNVAEMNLLSQGSGQGQEGLLKSISIYSGPSCCLPCEPCRVYLAVACIFCHLSKLHPQT